MRTGNAKSIRRVILAITVIAAVVGAVFHTEVLAAVDRWFWRGIERSKTPIHETAAARAHRLCTACGLSESEVDEMIRNKRESPLSREEEIEAWKATYDPKDVAQAWELCLSCVEAVLDAAADRAKREVSDQEH